MNTKIDKADYAILYAVTLEQWPAWLLIKEKTMEGIDRWWPGLQPSELTEHFFRLWSEGFIECAEGEDEPAIAPDYELAKQQFRSSIAVGFGQRSACGFNLTRGRPTKECDLPQRKIQAALRTF